MFFNTFISLFVNIGWSISNLKFLFSEGFEKMLGFGPSVFFRDITNSSLMGSIGGLVTWAKHCLK